MGAIVAFIVGRQLIGLAARLVVRALERQKVEPTVIGYIRSVVTVALNVILVVAILGYFGIETTSFAALVAGLGVAIGAAAIRIVGWSFWRRSTTVWIRLTRSAG